MANYKNMTVENGFKMGTEVGGAVTIGASMDIKVSIAVHAKTVMDIYSELEKVKSYISASSWERIERAHVGGQVGFFFELFNLISGGHYDYYNKRTQVHIDQGQEAQAITQALHSAKTSDVTAEGHIKITGMSYVPSRAYVWVNTTVVKMNGKEAFTAVSNNPTANGADATGNDSNVSGHGTLHIIPKTMNLDKQQMCFLRA